MAAQIERPGHLRRVKRLLRERAVVALLGARQVGKTTLAKMVANRRRGPVRYFDLEDPRDLALLDEPTLALERLKGLVILDEIQQRPQLFPVLRVLADRKPLPARFLVLGSAAPALLRQGSESLAGRIGFAELPGFDLSEISDMDRLWLRGGFPPSTLARSHRASADWRRDFVRTFVQRDIPRMGVGISPAVLERCWAMLAHYHGQVLNASEIGRSLGVSHTSVRNYLSALAQAFVVRVLQPWTENVGKRIVKSPKVYLCDSGLLHTLLDLETRREIERHPKLGASWEGFLVDQVIARLGARREECFFWATQAGAELDLLVVRGSKRIGYEFKRTDVPRMTKSMHISRSDLKLSSLTLVHAGRDSYDLHMGVRAVSASALLREVKAIRR